MSNALTDLRVPSVTIVDELAAPEITVVASLIAAIAGRDGILSPREFEAGLRVAESVAHVSEFPAVVRSMILRAFDTAPKSVEDALRALVSARGGIAEATRRPLLEAFFPLLMEQGKDARPLARQIAAALALPNPDVLLSGSALPVELSYVAALMQYAESALNTGNAKMNIAIKIAEFSGDKNSLRKTPVEAGDLDQNLDHMLRAMMKQVVCSVTKIAKSKDYYDSQLKVAHALDRTADELERQYKARLRAIAKRIELLRKHVAEDTSRLAEDGGDEAEVDLRRMAEKRGILLRHDDRDVRERVIVKSLARRHNELKSRYDEEIQLLRDELSEFRNDFYEAARSAVSSISLADWRNAIPGPTTAALVKDALDHGANRTLAGGAVAAVGAVGAVHFGLIAPAVVVGIVAAPVGAAVLGVIAAAGLWKMFADRSERLRGEQRDRAEAIRQAAHGEIGHAFSQVSAAIAEIGDGFREACLSQLAPLRHQAERIRESCILEQKLIHRIEEDVQHRCTQWQTEAGLVGI